MKIIIELDSLQDAKKAILALNNEEPKEPGVSFEKIKKQWFKVSERMPKLKERVLSYHRNNRVKSFQINWTYEWEFFDPKQLNIEWKNGEPDLWTYLIAPEGE